MTRALPARDAPPQTLLAFDPGHRHIGVAVGQTLTGTATPLAALPTRKSEPDWPALSRLVESWEPQAMVVGLPLNMDGTEQDTTHLARRFRNELKARFGVPVHFVDERLSTREARDRLAREGRAGEEDDAVAAQVILEDWFAQRARRELPARPLHHGSILLEDAEVLEHERFDAAQHRLRLHAPRIAEAALPGAFVHIRCDAGLPMRRPMSIMWAERRTGWIEVLFKEVGAGTRLLARKEPGACLSLLGPIGNPFEAQAGCSRPLLIGGGVGGCAGCTVGIRTPSGPAMKRVCVDGPVFDAHQVVWPTE